MRVNVTWVELPQVASQAHGEATIGDRQQYPRAFEAGEPCNGLGQPRRLADRFDAEHRRRPTVEHDPVVDALRDEELPPAQLAHAHLRWIRYPTPLALARMIGRDAPTIGASPEQPR